ncbi:unnamed protein product [Peronospora belbahrii]|uniref:Uncharacterized protein n=1 Tax=Peronospora belbahrii TaxID=622444 RepID=A0ABN8CQD9_9STRA|nr:unnamed protein product [Peronospora belbahrii]
MTPPADGENIKIGAYEAAISIETTRTDNLGSSMQSNKALALPVSPTAAQAESEGEEEDEMVNVLEDLILEAYNNMQIDGEYICLPDKVAEKLHQVADQITLQQSREVQQQQTENCTSTGENSGSEDLASMRDEVEEVKVLQEEVSTLQPDPEQEMEQKREIALVSEIENGGVQDKRGDARKDEETKLHKVQVLLAETAKLREEQHKQRINRDVSAENICRELSPVPEIDESTSSEPPSPSPPPSPRLSQSHSAANTPIVRAKKTPAHCHGRFASPSLTSLTTTSPSPRHIGKSPVYRTPVQSSGSKQKGKMLTYETRREAALKQKEDKKKRELLVRETARKQREDSKRKLEEKQQREMEEKRERVRRIREERLQRRTGKASTPGVKGTKKNG